MKTLLLFTCILLYITSSSQSVIPISDGKVIYNEIVSVQGLKKDELYSNAKLWFANIFKSSKDVIQLDDKDGGIILGKGCVLKKETQGLTYVENTYRFTVKIQVKDEKYKAEIYSIDHTFEMPGNTIGAKPSTSSFDDIFSNPKIFKKDGSMKPATLKLANKSNDIFNGVLLSIKKSMTEKNKSDF